MIFLLCLAFLAQAGEVGMRLEGPAPGGAFWLAQTWDWKEWTLGVYAEGAPFPPSFRLSNLKLAWNPGQVTLSPELVLFASGRTDLFFSGSAKGSAPFYGMDMVFQAGFKTGWVGVNIAPAQILLAWSLFRLEKDKFSVEFDLDGPAPWRGSLAFSSGSVAISLGSTISLTISQENDWCTGSSGFQLFPSPAQFHTLRWNWENTELQAFLASSGQAWFKARVSQKDWTSSALFSRSPEGGFQAVLEVRWSF